MKIIYKIMYPNGKIYLMHNIGKIARYAATLSLGLPRKEINHVFHTSFSNRPMERLDFHDSISRGLNVITSD